MLVSALRCILQKGPGEGVIFEKGRCSCYRDGSGYAP